MEFPRPHKFRQWRMHYRKEVSGSSSNPPRALEWIIEQENAVSVDELEEDDGFETLNAKLSTALTRCFTGEFARKMQIVEEEYLKRTKKLLKGRQLGWYMDQHFTLGDAEGMVLEFQDLAKVKLLGDNLSGFQNDWDWTISGMKEIPSDTILETCVATN